MYKILRTLLFFFPTEGVHYFSMNTLKGLCQWGWSCKLVTWACAPEDKPQASEKTRTTDERKSAHLSRDLFGLSFRNPVGLGAGFDKNALYLRVLDALGFG